MVPGSSDRSHSASRPGPSFEERRSALPSDSSGSGPSAAGAAIPLACWERLFPGDRPPSSRASTHQEDSPRRVAGGARRWKGCSSRARPDSGPSRCRPWFARQRPWTSRPRRLLELLFHGSRRSAARTGWDHQPVAVPATLACWRSRAACSRWEDSRRPRAFSRRAGRWAEDFPGSRPSRRLEVDSRRGSDRRERSGRSPARRLSGWEGCSYCSRRSRRTNRPEGPARPDRLRDSRGSARVIRSSHSHLVERKSRSRVATRLPERAVPPSRRARCLPSSEGPGTDAPVSPVWPDLRAKAPGRSPRRTARRPRRLSRWPGHSWAQTPSRLSCPRETLSGRCPERPVRRVSRRVPRGLEVGRESASRLRRVRPRTAFRGPSCRPPAPVRRL